MEDRIIYSLKASVLEQGYEQSREELALILIRKISFIKSIYEKELSDKSFKYAKSEEDFLKISMGFKQSSEDLIGELKTTILHLQALLSKRELEVTGYKQILFNINQNQKIRIWEDAKKYR